MVLILPQPQHVHDPRLSQTQPQGEAEAPMAKLITAVLSRCAMLALMVAAGSGLARAEPVILKVAYFSSDRAISYLAAITPFVEAVNAAAGGTVKFETYTSGKLGKNPTEQLQLVLDGTADLAFIVSGYTPERFRDDEVIELPGLFHDAREATLVFTRLVGQDALSGYESLFVVGAFGTEPEIIHVRAPVTSLEDLQGKRIRANNPIQAATLEKLGMVPVQIPVNQVAAALSRGEIDGATASPRALIEFGIARLTAYHFLLPVGSVPLTLVMSKARFDKLPPQAQEAIRRYSGEWAAERFISLSDQAEKNAIKELRTNPDRKVILPSERDRSRAGAAFEAVIAAWRDARPRNRELLEKAEKQLAKIKSGG